MKRMLPKYAGGKPDIIDDETLDFIIQHEGFKPDTMGKDLVTGAPWIGSGIEVQKYLDQFNKTGKWSAEDNKKAIREILQGYTPHLRKTFGNAWDTLNREQKRVLYDIAYNIGVGNLTAEKSPNFVKAVISGDTDRAKKEMNWGNHQARGLAIRNAHRQALWGNSQVVKNDKGKVMTFGKDFWKVAPKQSYKSLWEPEQPINTVYPVSGKTETPESLSSWKGADAPNAAPRLKDFLEVRQEDLNRGIDVYGDPVSPFSLRLRLPLIPSLFSELKDGKLPGYSNGKPIRIKPENRGKLTRLKKRTGKSESELYNDGNPAHRKMVVFARNARKWKH